MLGWSRCAADEWSCLAGCSFEWCVGISVNSLIQFKHIPVLSKVLLRSIKWINIRIFLFPLQSSVSHCYNMTVSDLRKEKYKDRIKQNNKINYSVINWQQNDVNCQTLCISILGGMYEHVQCIFLFIQIPKRTALPHHQIFSARVIKTTYAM